MLWRPVDSSWMASFIVVLELVFMRISRTPTRSYRDPGRPASGIRSALAGGVGPAPCPGLMCRDNHRNTNQITVQVVIVEACVVKVGSLARPLEVCSGVAVVDDRGVRGASRVR